MRVSKEEVNSQQRALRLMQGFYAKCASSASLSEQVGNPVEESVVIILIIKCPRATNYFKNLVCFLKSRLQHSFVLRYLCEIC